MTSENALEKILSATDRLGFTDSGCVSEKQVTTDTLLEDFMDSLDVVELAMELEKETNVKITDASVESWETVADVVNTYIIVTDNGK